MSGRPVDPVADPPRRLADQPPAVSTTLLLGLAAVALALIAIFGEAGSFTGPVVAAALVGLVPWALVVGGVDVPGLPFAVASLLPAAYIVVVAENPGGMFPMMLLVVWITRVSPSRWLIAATIAAAAACIAALAVDKASAHETGMVYFLGGLGISWLTGALLRRQDALTAEVRAMHQLQVEQLAATERTRIAREVHDVVAHSLTIVMLNLTGARRALRTHPERAEEALARAETVGRESLDSIRQVMGLLREPGSGADLPQPGLGDLPTLVDGYRGAGMDAALEVASGVPSVDPTVGLVAFRVVQESLANVLQHAPGAVAVVRVGADGGALQVSVANGPPAGLPPSGASRTGLGVRGMAERVRAVGGEVHAGPDGDGGWVVTATIPVRTAGGGAAVAGDGVEVAWASRPVPR